MAKIVSILTVFCVCLLSGKALVVDNTKTVKPQPPTSCTLHDDSTCPNGSCCVRDEFFFSDIYCKHLGRENDSCTIRESEYECPCSPNLECKPNIIAAGRPSLFGKCHLKPGLNLTTTQITSSMGDSYTDSTTNSITNISFTTSSDTMPPLKESSVDQTSNTTTLSLLERNSTTAPKTSRKFNDPGIVG